MKRIYLIVMGLLATLLGACAGNQNIESVNAEAFKKEISADDVQLIDVRTPTEFTNGHIEGAINLDIKRSDFVDEANKTLDKTLKVYLYCRSGARSMQAANKLAKEGYQIVNLKGGIIEWEGEGLPVVR
ncbi:rhodanese-like domain-containing protein [Porphyromonadaceae bacterium W3.11]|nr:rhodanese-like domain-containing protein [Porphyromonadaceae bacterium W3.11]